MMKKEDLLKAIAKEGNCRIACAKYYDNWTYFSFPKDCEPVNCSSYASEGRLDALLYEGYDGHVKDGKLYSNFSNYTNIQVLRLPITTDKFDDKIYE